MPCSALLKLPRWVASGGRDFVFYHSYPGLSMGTAQADATFASVVCKNFQWATMLAAEQVCFKVMMLLSHQGMSKELDVDVQEQLRARLDPACCRCVASWLGQSTAL